MDSLAIIIDSIIDDFIRTKKTKKINLVHVFGNYNNSLILDYYNSISFKQLKVDYSDICENGEYVVDAYNNFNTASKKSFIGLLKYVIEFTEEYINTLQKIKYNKIKYSKFVILSGNKFRSLSLDQIENSKLIFTFNVKTNCLLAISGNLELLENGQILGIEQIFSEKLLCPYFIINELTNGEAVSKEIFKNMKLIPNNTFKINPSTFLVRAIH